MKFLWPALGAVLLAWQAPDPQPLQPSSITRQLREGKLDATACYRVRELTLVKEDVRIFLTDGYLIFAHPLNGKRLSAMFSAETEGGDGEILMLPPHRGERRSLASFTKSPNLSEHISSALMIFTDDTAAALLAEIERTGAKRSEEMGVLLSDRWSETVRNIQASFEVRLLEDLLDGAQPGFFFMAAAGKTLGNFDIFLDPRAREQVVAGQLTQRNNRTLYDIWTSFESRSVRKGAPPVLPSLFRTEAIRIDAELLPDLRIRAVTRSSIQTLDKPVRAVALEISRRMKLTEARVNGEPAQIFLRESLRGTALRGGDSETFLVVPARELPAGARAEVEIRHEGNVIGMAGNNVYFVGSRATWYPHRIGEFVMHDVTFRYPKALSLAIAGEIVDDQTEGERRITRTVTRTPVRAAGFNLGNYEKAKSVRGGLTVEVFGNRAVETALSRPPAVVFAPPTIGGLPPRRSPELMASPSLPPDPTARLRAIAEDVASTLEFLTERFGPPPAATLRVSPIPGTFGQGFPGLLYLSTIAYLDPSQRPAALRSPDLQLFFSELLEEHETAHQWFGNLVIAAGYQDEWLMESLANYAALMFLEKKRGPRAVESVLEDYRKRLLRKGDGGATVESAGPIVWGVRLTSMTPEAWRAITYEKGSWIIHMLRYRMGDESFRAMLAELLKRYRLQPITTEQFRKLAAGFLPAKSRDPRLEEFFEAWVYGTGVPTLALNHAVKPRGKEFRLTGTLAQTQVDEDFSVDVPIEIQFARGAPMVHWVRSSTDPVNFAVTLPQRPVRVTLSPGNAILAQKR